MNIKNLLKEVFLGILPILAVITLLQFTIAPIDLGVYINFLWSTVAVIIGLLMFLIGIEYGFLKIGESLGNAIVKTGKLRLILLFGVAMGFAITLVEPDVRVFSEQVAAMISNINGFQLWIIIGIGVGLSIGLAFLRMFTNMKMKYIVLIGYLLAFGLILFCPGNIAIVAFDAGGATTGALTVPFILSIAMGISSIISHKTKTSGSFGIIGIASIGPILAVLIMGVLAK